MILKELLRLANLFEAQILGIYELLEIIIVVENNDIIFVVYSVIMPISKSFYNA